MTEMTETAERYERLAAAFTDKVAAVPEDRWASLSPCEEWTARDVVRHVIDSHGIFLGFVGRELGDIPSVDDDPAAAWDGARKAVQADLDDPERAGEVFERSMGPMSFAQAIDRFICFDLLVHAWDLARAAGIDDRMDAEEARRVLEQARIFGDALRGPGGCGPAIEAPPGASDQDRLLAFLGRRP